MNKSAKCIIVACSLFLTACASTNSDFADIELVSEAHPEFHLANYGSFAWAGNASLVFDAEGRWEPPDYDLDAEVNFLIDQELRNQGLLESDIRPDLLVSFGIAIGVGELPFEQALSSDLPSFGQVPQGALVITLADSRLGSVVWIGLAAANIDETPDNDLSRQRLQYAVSGLLNSLPD